MAALNTHLNDFQQGEWTAAALKILGERYLHRRHDGSQETPEEMLWRVAYAIAAADAKHFDSNEDNIFQVAHEFYGLMLSQKFLPNSPTLMNAGLENALQYSACYVLPVDDSIVGVFDTIKNAVIIHKSGGGTGFSFSRLRPKGSRVNATGGVASGPVSFMTVFNQATEVIKQGGRRRGANMGILRIDHPDIEEFITCKAAGGITNFNISVAITEAFMSAFEANDDYDLLAQPDWPAASTYPGPGKPRYAGGEKIGRKNAREMFGKIVDMAWRTGDPGLVFIDRVNDSRANPMSDTNTIEACNPCVTGDTFVCTERGLVTIKDLYQSPPVRVSLDMRRSGLLHQGTSAVVLTGKRVVYRLQTEEGYHLRLTGDHRVMTERGWVAALDLVPGDQIHIFNRRGVVVKNEGVMTRLERMFKYGEFQLTEHGAINIDLSRPTAQQAQILLQNLGIVSRISNRSDRGLFISSSSLIRTKAEFGSLLTAPQSELLDIAISRYDRDSPETFTAHFESLTEDGIEEVYDLTEPVSHSFVANGIVVHNCGEQFLFANDACNLGSVNVSKFVVDHKIDWAALGTAVKIAVHFLDNVITANPFPLAEIEKVVKGNRRIGLGVMGWADLLFILLIPYDSEQALVLATKLMGYIRKVAREESARLAGAISAFPNWCHSRYKNDTPMRNSTVTAIAPTGSISIVAGASGGIEPIFALAYQHVVKQPEGDNRVLTFINPVFEETAKELGFWSESLMAKVLKHGSVQGLAEVPEDIQRVFVTAHEIEPMWHIRMQAAFQIHTDNGVSKTINLPGDATRQDIETAYLLAYETGCLGITVFRDGCKGEQVLNVGIEAEAENSPGLDKTPLPRPVNLRGVTYRKNTPVGTVYVTVNSDDDEGPFEVFVTVGKGGSALAADAEGLGRLLSLILRLPSPLSPRERAQDIVGQLRGIGGGRSQGFGKQRVMSLADAVAQVLAEHIGLETTDQLFGGLPDVGEAPKVVGMKTGDLCPECGQASFVYEEGCQKCYGCGYSEC